MVCRMVCRLLQGQKRRGALNLGLGTCQMQQQLLVVIAASWESIFSGEPEKDETAYIIRTSLNMIDTNINKAIIFCLF